MTETTATGKGINAFTLKMIAIIAMLMDHISYIFLPEQIWMRVIGKLTFPIMAFFIVQGYHHTRDVKRYVLRLLIAAAISAVPFGMAFGHWINAGNVMLTLALGLIALWVMDHVQSQGKRVALIVLLCTLSIFGDWQIVGVPIIISFGMAYKQGKLYNTTTLAMFAVLFINGIASAIAAPQTALWIRLLMPLAYGGAGVFALPLLKRYNGQRGTDARWLFYGFYPVHLAILAAINLLFVK